MVRSDAGRSFKLGLECQKQQCHMTNRWGASDCGWNSSTCSFFLWILSRSCNMLAGSRAVADLWQEPLLKFQSVLLSFYIMQCFVCRFSARHGRTMALLFSLLAVINKLKCGHWWLGVSQSVAMRDAPIKETAWIPAMNLLATGSWDKTLKYVYDGFLWFRLSLLIYACYEVACKC